MACASRILIVPHEGSASQELAGSILMDAGCSVVLAKSGMEALTVFEKRHKEMSLVILDLIMPGMGGKEGWERLLAIDPEANILVSSGFSTKGLSETLLQAGSGDFLGKPYDTIQLLTKVREVLDRKCVATPDSSCYDETT